ncbi:g132 [Coccomyxa viridis]|uniref:HVA22-like protein n=1 Tax=Coccomyxa viridis TaxID=1274662 RepID=A0ABP1FHY8_9CHLO
MVNFRIILTYTLNLFFGLLYPTWKSVEAVESKSQVDDAQWLSYWIIYTLLLVFETLLWPALKWLPLYGELKAILLAWLVLPHTKGATYLYENFVGPGFHKVKAEARKVPALQKLIDGNAPKAT